MSRQLEGRRVAILVTDGVEQVELTGPRRALDEAGATTHIVSPRPGSVQGFNHLDKGDAFRVDRTLDAAKASDYDALLLPGGVANPDALRMDERAVRFVRETLEAGKPVAAICHGPWLLVEAGAVKGRTLTSWPSLATDIRNAGGTWVDAEVHADRGVVTSRKPADLGAFCRSMVDAFAGGAQDYDEVVEESFPASDAPATTPVTSVGEPAR